MWSATQSDHRSLFPSKYIRHEPEKSTLYQVVAENWNTFRADSEQDPESRGIPKYIKKEFDAYLKCGILQYGFLRVRCESCTEERLVAFSCKRRGFCPSCGGRRMAETAAKLSDNVIPKVAVRQWVLSLPIPMRYWLASNPRLVTSVLEILMRALSSFYKNRAKFSGIKNSETGAITFVQRFGSALNLNVHFHILFLDGVYHRPSGSESPSWARLQPPEAEEIKMLVEKLSLRISRHLKRKGYLKESEGQNQLAGEETDPLQSQSPLLASCVAASVQNKTALYDRAGLYVRKLGIHPLEARVTGFKSASMNGFSLHGGVCIEANDRAQLEHLIRYVARPAIALERLTRTHDGNLTYRLKRTFTDGTNHVLFSPMELIEKLVALVPRPRVHLVRYHGVLAPHSKWRKEVVPTPPKMASPEIDDLKEAPGSRAKRISWARLLKRVFDIDVSFCFSCRGEVRVIAAILDRAIIIKILSHLKLPTEPPKIAAARAPPQGHLAFDDTF